MSDQNEAEKCRECNGEGYNDIGSNRVACAACACTGLADPAYIAQLRTDAKTLAAEVRAWRNGDGSQSGPYFIRLSGPNGDKLVDDHGIVAATDASGALTRHAGDGT